MNTQNCEMPNLCRSQIRWMYNMYACKCLIQIGVKNLLNSEIWHDHSMKLQNCNKK